MVLESCYLQETQRRARALSVHNGPERGLLSQGAKASPRPRLPKQKPSGRGATNHGCPVRSAFCPGNVLTSQAPSPALVLSWQAPLTLTNYPLFFSFLPPEVATTVQPFFLSLQ